MGWKVQELGFPGLEQPHLDHPAVLSEHDPRIAVRTRAR
jgi:hypothetical protein